MKIKIMIPPVPTNLVERPSLFKHLDRDLLTDNLFTRRLTLISAPAGSGKTTMARSWAGSRQNRAAWYTLDDGDNEPARFWAYLISAVQNIEKSLGRVSLSILLSAAPGLESPVEEQSFLTPFLNDLLAINEPLFLVVDDYHLINNVQIHRAMTYFIENLPPTLHLVITTRSEPPWPLSRWRARGLMAELRQKELKFTRAEAESLLTKSRDLCLNEIQLDLLYEKTDGWVTGLCLAYHALLDRVDLNQFIETFSGSHRHIFHFLSEEVLKKQPDSIREFLMHTAILNSFTASLCDKVTGRSGSAEILADLERQNLFVISLDDRGMWYRYHPLFADLLRHQLKQVHPEIIYALNEKAAEWYLKAGEPGEAVRHLLKGGNLEQAARTINDNLEEIMHAEGPGLVVDSLELFPPDLLSAFPYLVVQKGWFALVHKGRELADHYLKSAEEMLRGEQNLQVGITGMLAVVRAYYHINAHQFSLAVENAEKALEMLPDNSNYWRSKVGIILGDARLFSGNPDGAYPYYMEAHLNNQAYGNTYLILTTGFKVATNLYFLGNLRESEKLARELLETARREGFTMVPRVGLIWVLLGEVLREKGALEEAERCVERGLLISEPEKPSLGWNYLFRAALSFSQGRYEDMLAATGEVEKLHRKLGLPRFIMLPAAGWQARALYELDESDRAKEILQQAGVKPDQGVTGGEESCFLVLTRLLLSEKSINTEQVHSLLEAIESLALSGKNQRILIETLLLKAILARHQGNRRASEKALTTALEKGKSSGFLQIFRDEYKNLEQLFSGLTADDKSGTTVSVNQDILDYIDQVRLDNMSTLKSTGLQSAMVPQAGESNDLSHQGLVEELSARELEILNFMAKGLSNRDIAEKLYISVGTVKWYTSNIYGKLGARNRAAAVGIAQKLNLIISS